MKLSMAVAIFALTVAASVMPLAAHYSVPSQHNGQLANVGESKVTFAVSDHR